MKRLPALVAAAALVAGAIYTTPTAQAQSASTPVVTYENNVLCITAPPPGPSACKVISPEEGVGDVGSHVPSVTYDHTNGVCYSAGGTNARQCTGPISFSKPVVTYDETRGVCVQPSPSAQGRCTGPIQAMALPDVTYDSVNGFCIHDSAKSTCTGAVGDRLDEALGRFTYDEANGACIQASTGAVQGSPLCTGPVPDPTQYDPHLPSVFYSPTRGLCVEMRTFVSADHCTGRLPVPVLPGMVEVTVVNVWGVPIPNARVAVYVEPYEVEEAYTPVLIGRGDADAAGRFRVAFDGALLQRLVDEEAIPSVDEDSLNLFVLAVDKAKTQRASWNFIGELGTKTEVAVRADESLIGEPWAASATEDELVFADTRVAVSHTDVLATPPGFTGSYPQPSPDTMGDLGETVGHAKRWPDVVELHLSKGMSGYFEMSEGRETSTEVAVNACTPSACNGWSARGWMEEANGRTDVRRLGKDGPYHNHIAAHYRYRLYRWCSGGWGYPDNGKPYCLKWVYRWEPRKWLVDLKTAREASRPTRDPKNDQVLSVNEFWSTQQWKNRSFGAAFNLAGINLSAQAGYTSNTELAWWGTAGCSGTRYLYGANDVPNGSKVVYAECS